MTSEIIGCAEVVSPPPRLTLPRGDLEAALVAMYSAIRQLQSAQEVKWQSVAAQFYRRQVYAAIQEVRRVLDHVEQADADWARLRSVASANGHWG